MSAAEMRRAKIVATLGPASRDPEVLRGVLRAGADVVRVNFAHDRPELHENAALTARSEAAALGRTIGVLVDLPGPKMRTGPIEGDEVRLEIGHEFVLTSEQILGDDKRASTTVPQLASMATPGDEIYLADGAIVLSVVAVDGGDIRTEILRGGVLRSRKGMHLPRAERHVRAFTPEDEATLKLALKFKADLIGLSFVRDADDVRRAAAALPKRGPKPFLVAKIETASALDNLADIASEADALMVARGDLGIQLPMREVPLLQKHIIRLANEAGVPVITATQMLESMTHAPLPTRAEVTDVANAVLDGTDALMLSEETAVGDHPAVVVAMMAEIIQAAEREGARTREPEAAERAGDEVSWAVAHAAVLAADDLGMAAILCPTRSGATARRVAAWRPRAPIVGLGARPEVLGPLALVWGVVPLLTPEIRDEGEEVWRAVAAARKAGLVEQGSLVAVVAGSPGRRAGSTDFVRIVRV